MNQPCRIGCKFIVDAMNVFADIHPTGLEVWQHFLKGCNLLIGSMAAIIYQDVNFAYLFFEGRPKLTILLVAYENRHIVSLVFLTFWFDIDAINMASVAKIGSPHIQTTSAEYANFHNMSRLSDKATQVAMIEIEIVLPFPN